MLTETRSKRSRTFEASAEEVERQVTIRRVMPPTNLLLLLSVPAADAGPAVEFNRDVRPILADDRLTLIGRKKR